MSAADADPVNAAAAARASTNFFMFSSPILRLSKSTTRQGARAPIPKIRKVTIRGSTRNAVAGGAHSSENEIADETRKSASFGLKRPQKHRNPAAGLPEAVHAQRLDVQQILAGEFRLVGDEGESRLGL